MDRVSKARPADTTRARVGAGNERITSSKDSVTAESFVKITIDGKAIDVESRADAVQDAKTLRALSKSSTLSTQMKSLLAAIATATAKGGVVVVGAGARNLTSQQVADMLNVSRPYVVKLARDGVLAHVMVGNRHRFAVADVEAYAAQASATRREALATISAGGDYRPGDI
jgi:excisionase family DNA binding protein